MNACDARGGYEKRGGGDAVLFRPDPKAGGGGGYSLLQVRYEKCVCVWGGSGCLPYDDLYLGLCARAS